MIRYTDEQWDELRLQYLAAAIRLVVREGWSALSVRKVGEMVGRSGNAVHQLFKGISLKREVIRTAFQKIAAALEPYDGENAPARDQMHRIMLDHLRANPWVAALMLQVTAQAPLSATEEADELQTLIQEERARLTVHIAGVLRRLDGGGPIERRMPTAERTMCWYTAVCALIAGGPVASDIDLLAMGRHG